jgi:hypothetical protein
MLTANSSPRAEGASPPLKDVLPSKKANTDTFLQSSAGSCRDDRNCSYTHQLACWVFGNIRGSASVPSLHTLLGVLHCTELEYLRAGLSETAFIGATVLVVLPSKHHGSVLYLDREVGVATLSAEAGTAPSVMRLRDPTRIR